MSEVPLQRLEFDSHRCQKEIALKSKRFTSVPNPVTRLRPQAGAASRGGGAKCGAGGLGVRYRAAHARQ